MKRNKKGIHPWEGWKNERWDNRKKNKYLFNSSDETINIDGKEFSKSTIKNALKEYIS